MSYGDIGNKRKPRFNDVLYPVSPAARHIPQGREPLEGPGDILRPTPEQTRPEILRGDAAGNVGQVHTLSGLGRRIPVLTVRGNDRNPELITIQALASKPDGTPPDYAVTLAVQYGTGGAQHEALVSVGHGTQITLAATGISISAMLEESYPGQPEPDSEVFLSVGFASGSRNAPSPLYVRSANIPPGNRGVFDVAAFAHEVSLFSDSNLAGDLLTQEASGAVALSSIAIGGNLEASNGYQLVTGARQIAVLNNGIVAKRVMVAYRLAL